MALGAAIAVLPAFAWYSAPRAGGALSASGFGGAGQLLLLPVLGALAAMAGVAVLLARRERRPASAWTGPVAAGSGALALVFAFWAATSPAVEVRASLPGGTEVVPTRVEVEPAAIVTILLAAALLAVGAGVAWAGRRP